MVTQTCRVACDPKELLIFRSTPSPAPRLPLKTLANRPGLTTAALAIASVNAALMQTIVVPAQQQLPQLLNASPAATAWVITVSLLTAAVSMPIAGRLGDLYGKRRIITFLLAVQVIGSVVSALTDDLVIMLIGRALQGTVLGVVALSIALLQQKLPPTSIPSATALLSASIGIGAALGLPGSALLMEVADWRTPFWVTAGLALASMLLVLLAVPETSTEKDGRFDYVGAALLAAGLSGFLVALSQGATWGWGSVATIGVGAGGILLLVLWAFVELRVRNPLVDLRVTARRPVLLTNLTAICMGFALFASNVAIPQILQLPTAGSAGLGLSLVQASLVLMPAGLFSMATAPLAGKLITAVGPRAVMIGSALLLAASYGYAALAPRGVLSMGIVMVLVGVAVGAGYAAMPAVIMASTPREQAGSANSVNGLMRSVGTSVASAAVGVVLASMTESVGATQVATSSAFTVAFVIAVAASLLAGVLALSIRRERAAS